MDRKRLDRTEKVITKLSKFLPSAMGGFITSTIKSEIRNHKNLSDSYFYIRSGIYFVKSMTFLSLSSPQVFRLIYEISTSIQSEDKDFTLNQLVKLISIPAYSILVIHGLNSLIISKLYFNLAKIKNK